MKCLYCRKYFPSEMSVCCHCGKKVLHKSENDDISFVSPLALDEIVAQYPNHTPRSYKEGLNRVSKLLTGRSYAM